MTTTTVRYWPADEPIPPGWVESTPAADLWHHGFYSRLVRLVDPEADRQGDGLAVNRQGSLVSWPSPEDFWP